MKIISIALAEQVRDSGSSSVSGLSIFILLFKSFEFFYYLFFTFFFFYFLGRAGAKGLAVSFFTDKASKMAGDLVTILREANQEIPSQLESMRSFGGGGGGRYGGR